MRQFGFRGRARDVELGGERTDGVERATSIANRLLLLLGGHLERPALVVGRAASSRADSRAPGRGRRAAAARRPPWRSAARAGAHQRDVATARLGARSRSRAAPSRRSTSAATAECPFDERGVRRTRFGGALAHRLRVVACGRQPPLRSRRGRSRGAARSSQPRDRFARLRLTGVEGGNLLADAARLRRHQLRALRQTRVSSAVARFNCASTETIAFSCRCSSATGRDCRRARRSSVEGRRLALEPLERRRSAPTRSRSSLISRLVARMPRDSMRAAGHQIAAAQHVAVERDHRQRRAGRPGPPRLRGRHDDGVADYLAQLCAKGPVTRITSDSSTAPRAASTAVRRQGAARR